MFNKLKTIVLSPLFVFGIIAVSLLLFLIVTVNFQVPSYYTDIGLAQQIADVHGDITSLINPVYRKFNYTFNAFSFFLALFIICLLFKIKTFKDFSKPCTLKNKRNISIWVNVFYPLWASLSYNDFSYGFLSYVYPCNGDLRFMPIYTYATILFLFGVIYYIFMNFLCSALYQGKFSSKVKYTITTILCLFAFCNIVVQFYFRYSLLYATFLFMLSLVWLFIVISLSKLDATNSDCNNDEQIRFSWLLFIALFIILSILLSVCYFIPLLSSFVMDYITYLPFIMAIIFTFLYTNVINKKLNPKVQELLSKTKKIFIIILGLFILITLCLMIILCLI